jgi:hypothetical protein
MIPTAADVIAHRGLTKSISQAVEEDVAAAAAFDVLLRGWRPSSSADFRTVIQITPPAPTGAQACRATDEQIKEAIAASAHPYDAELPTKFHVNWRKPRWLTRPS